MEPRRSTTTKDGLVGPDVWICSGIKILGTPVGDAEFRRRLSEERIGKLEQFWRAIAWVPDLQCAWHILLPCAGLSEDVAAQSAWYAGRHDEGMMPAMDQLLGGLPGDEAQQPEAKVIATMPMRLGSLGLRCRHTVGVVFRRTSHDGRAAARSGQ